MAKPSDETIAQPRERGVGFIPGRYLSELQHSEVPLGNVGRANGGDSGKNSWSLAAVDATNRWRNEGILCACSLGVREGAKCAESDRSREIEPHAPDHAITSRSRAATQSMVYGWRMR